MPRGQRSSQGLLRIGLMLSTDDLRKGELELVGLLPWASNYSFLANLGDERVVYKPRKGEAPLWDFDDGTLCLREVAAYLVSESGGWNFVPPTVLRAGPSGLGAVQVFVDHDPNITAFELLGRRNDDLRSVAVFDLVINNADRKAGHVILEGNGRLWAVDHGICFHSDPKLRTVLWDFAGESFPDRDLKAIESVRAGLAGPLCEELGQLLSESEIEALEQRVEALLANPVFPYPGLGRNIPWPPT